jgi:hypothetical protein
MAAHVTVQLSKARRASLLKKAEAEYAWDLTLAMT